MAKQRLAIWTAVSKPDKAKASDADVKDKYSLQDQELHGLQFGRDNDYELVKIFRWPGHSRDESDVVQALEDFAAAGRFEYHELREMWRKKAFDVLWCHNHSRLGRSFTLQSWVIENIIRSGARIYREVGGWINADDYGGQIALGGWANTQERGRRLLNNDAGLTKRAERGLNLTQVPFPHRLVRDPVDGKAIRMEVDPANRVFLDHLHELMMGNIPLTWLGRALSERYGHVNPATGKPWGERMLYEMLHRPSFWGHNARYFSQRDRKWSLFRDGWGFDTSAPIPDGVLMIRNTHEPAYTGKQADEVQSMIRFHKSLHSVTPPSKVHYLSGVVYCPECFRQLRYNKTSAKHVKYYYITCCGHYEYKKGNTSTDCQNTQHIRETVVLEFVEQILRRAVAGEDLRALFGENQTVSTQARVEHLKIAIHEQKQYVERLARQSAQLYDDMPETYRNLITEAETMRDQHEKELRQLTAQQSIDDVEVAIQHRAIEDLKAIPPEDYWNTDKATMNRHIKDIFGYRAIFILDRTIVGVERRPARSKKRGMPYVLG